MKKNKKAYKTPLLRVAGFDETEFIAQSFTVNGEIDDEWEGDQW